MFASPIRASAMLFAPRRHVPDSRCSRSRRYRAEGCLLSQRRGDRAWPALCPCGRVRPGQASPPIVVIHEWWGLNDWVKAQAADLAAHGYFALAVDLYRGQVANDTDTAHQLSRGVPEDRAIRDMEAADDYLRLDKRVDPKRRVGADRRWCMGGGYALTFAVQDPNLKAIVANYGPPPTEPDSLSKIHAAILGNYGGQDKGIPPATVETFADAMKKLGKPVDVKIYPDAGHAFENPNNKTGYRAEDAADARTRYLHFFARELGGRP